jgi:hypothetical protein
MSGKEVKEGNTGQTKLRNGGQCFADYQILI